MLPDAASVAALRDRFGEVHTWGSGELLRGLMAAGALDRLNLWVYPVALGTGKRLFEAGATPLTLRPAEPGRISSTGVLSLALEPAGPVVTGNVGD